MRVSFLWIIIFLVLISSCQSKEESQPQSFLSHLQADKNSPLYATYAAAMQRSEFVLDEGYEYHFYDENENVGFYTDTGGDLLSGFLIDGEFISTPGEFYQQPVITTSYPDMVFSYFYPVKGLRVEIKFLVESSHSAIQEFRIRNETKGPLQFEFVPYMQNTYRAFNDVEMASDSSFLFTHEEYPDSWTLSHNMPYEDTIRNVFVVSKKPDKTGSVNLTSKLSPRIPWFVYPQKKPIFQLSGRSAVGGERNLVLPPDTRFAAFLNRDDSRILTHKSPVWGSMQGSVNRDGYYRAELGNLGVQEGDIYTLRMVMDNGRLLSGSYRDTVGVGPGLRHDIDLVSYHKYPVVTGIKVQPSENGTNITWDELPKGSLVNVYRRIYPEESAYTRIGAVTENRFSDSDNMGKTIGYVLAVYDPSTGELGPISRESTTLPVSTFENFLTGQNQQAFVIDYSRVLAFKYPLELGPEEEWTLRLSRTVGRTDELWGKIQTKAVQTLDTDISERLKENERLFSQALDLPGLSEDQKYLYWSAFGMMRQVFYPKEGKSSYNYYVFSREPTWGWGHGGQVFHESLTMPAYALLDPISAMNSQRIFAERQYDNGYINYRTGSYLDEKIEYDGELTSSAPWYNYQNWQLYEMTGDKEFLNEMYASGKEFYEFYVAHRDKDGDGLCEWGGQAVLESVRDAWVAVWDEVGWPSNFEGLDLNCMLVMEAKSLEKMAKELGLQDESKMWHMDWKTRSEWINSTFWDGETGFYYHVDKKNNYFTFKNTNDLKRQEIIGFLPLWAGVASKEQARILVKKLTDPEKFWRKYGVPSLAADDPYYNDKGYWNGPIWVEWNYLIQQGLLDYGYEKEARELVERVAEGIIYQLKRNHNLWEFYSPDTTWAGYHRTYIWAGIINKMLWDGNQYKN